MRAVMNALLPVFALILLGYILRRRLLHELPFWAGANKLSYFVLLPALLVNQLARVAFRVDLLTSLWSVVIGAMLVVTLLVWLTKRWISTSNGAFTSVLQGSIRPNTYIALALPAALFGQEGVIYPAIVLAATVPLVNVLSVTALVHYQGGNGSDKQGKQPGSLRLILLSVMQNPLIAACVVGISLNLTGIELPGDLANVLTLLAQASLPIGLLTVGAGLDLAALKTAICPLLSATLVKLVISPVIALLFCWLLGVDPLTTAISAIFMALPCAAASYVLAERMGGDFQLMAGILTVETLAAGITLPLLLLWLL